MAHSFLYEVSKISELSEEELKRGIFSPRQSWHREYQESAYIRFDCLHKGLTEGDVAQVFSQFGEISDVRLVRDKDTGKSRGFGFVCYEDQRSTVLAVDNMNGSPVLGKVVKVNHMREYQVGRELGKVVKVNHMREYLYQVGLCGSWGRWSRSTTCGSIR